MSTNYRKATWAGSLDRDTDGRQGVFNYTGHFTKHAAGIHVRLARETDRPVSIRVEREDAQALIDMLTAFLATEEN